MSTDAEKKVEIDRILALEHASPSMFDILAIDPEGATMSTVKKAYNRLSICTHPDKTSVEGAAHAFALVNKAYKSFASEAVLERFKAAELKKRAALSGNSAAAAAATAAPSSAEAQEKAKAKLKEEYLAAVRLQEEQDRRRQREDDDAKKQEQQKKDIAQHQNDWKKFKTNNVGARL